MRCCGLAGLLTARKLLEAPICLRWTNVLCEAGDYLSQQIRHMLSALG